MAPCRLWDYVVDMAGNPVVNTEVVAVLAATDSAHADSPNGFIAPTAMSTYTNVSGYFDIYLVPSSGMAVETQYRIMIPRLYYSKLVTIPGSGISGVRLRDI